jgi:basic amino acid/polyamine antiporter, APA family
MGDPVLKYGFAAWQESGPGTVPTEAEELYDPHWGMRSRLRRTFRKRDGIALIVSNVVGVGIFTTPALIANLVPNPIAMLALWIAGGVLALAGAASYARLANLWPTAGGEYVYLSKAYGPSAGFLSGWTSLIAGFSGSVAASAVALVLFAGQYFPDLASDRSLVSLGLLGSSVISLSPRMLAAASVIAVFAILHICSLRAGKITQNGLALALVGVVAMFVGRGFATGSGSWSHFHSPGIHFGPMNWLLALIPVMFTYSGWNAAAYVSEEIHAGRRSMRPVLLMGTAIVIVLYVLLNVLYLYAIPPVQMRSATNVAESAARALFGAGSQMVTPALIVALLGAVSAMTIAGPRVYFAMARDGAFIPAFARTSPKFGTPALAIALQSLWSIALVMLGGFDQILMYTGFAIVLSSGAAVAGLFVVQRRSKHTASSKRARLVIPGIFVLASAALVIDTVLEAPRIALTGVLLITAGVPVYAACRRSSSARLALQPEEAAGD